MGEKVVGSFQVELKKVIDSSYEIEIGFGLQDKLIADLRNGLVGNITRFALVTDSIVIELYTQSILSKLVTAGFQADIFAFPAGEKQKTRKTKEIIEDAMLEKGYRRDCCIIAVGGGVVTDLAGFVAGTFGRGVPFINYATTLLAAADASVGGKTAVDTPLATNLIGLFNQPEKVYIDIATWKTLPSRQISSGLAETIKHACIKSKDLFDYLNDHMDEILNIEAEACEYIANCNCQIKYEVVMKDERENGLREVLNLGHTVGRAIETVSDYKLLHGEALSIGLVAEANLAYKLGYVNVDERDQVVSLLIKANLPTVIPEYIDKEALVKKLYTDKKVKNGQIRFVLQKGIGDVVEFSEGVFSTPIDEVVAREIVFQM